MQADRNKGARVHSPTAQALADATGVSRRMLFQAAKLRRDGCAELVQAVQAGAVSMRLALDVATFDPIAQRLILCELPSLPQRDRAGFVALLRGDALYRAREGAADA